MLLDGTHNIPLDKIRPQDKLLDKAAATAQVQQAQLVRAVLTLCSLARFQLTAQEINHAGCLLKHPSSLLTSLLQIFC